MSVASLLITSNNITEVRTSATEEDKQYAFQVLSRITEALPRDIAADVITALCSDDNPGHYHSVDDFLDVPLRLIAKHLDKVGQPRPPEGFFDRSLPIRSKDEPHSPSLDEINIAFEEARQADYERHIAEHAESIEAMIRARKELR
jgi:hypothetical protein